MSPATLVPSLDELARDPKCASGIPRTALSALLRRNAVVQSVLVAELESAQDQPARNRVDDTPDKMLTPIEASKILRRSPRWIYRRAARLPFVKRISRKSLLVSEAGLRRWLADRKA